MPEPVQIRAIFNHGKRPRAVSRRFWSRSILRGPAMLPAAIGPDQLVERGKQYIGCTEQQQWNLDKTQTM